MTLNLPLTLGSALLLTTCMACSGPLLNPTPPPVVDRSAVVIAQAAPPTPPAPAPVIERPLARRADVQSFIDRMVAEHGFDRTRLIDLFSQAEDQPDIIAAITRPAEAKPWHAYRQIFLTPERTEGGVAFWQSHADTLYRAEQVYGVPAEIIVAILGVETRYGGFTGRHRVLEALSTLAFDYPKRSEFFTKELENYLLLTREEGIDPLSLEGSYAGAMGLAQFMPSSYRAYAVDFDADDHRDLWQNPVDAIGSIANYLARHRWQAGAPVAVPANVSGNDHQSLLSRDLTPRYSLAELRQSGITPAVAVTEQPAVLLEYEATDGPEYWLGFNNFYVITRYNRSPLYAMAVYQLATAIRTGYQQRGN